MSTAPYLAASVWLNASFALPKIWRVSECMTGEWTYYRIHTIPRRKTAKSWILRVEVDTKCTEDCFYPLIMIIFTASMHANTYILRPNRKKFELCALISLYCNVYFPRCTTSAPCRRLILCVMRVHVYLLSWHKPRNRNYITMLSLHFYYILAV